MTKLNIQPNDVFEYFYDISQIPRGSRNEKRISDWLVNFAKERGFDVWQDQENNVIIKKPATFGYEKSPGVILQSHMDMVNEKNSETEHDFDNDPLDIYVEGDFVRAKETTLGADNGIALAMSLAVLCGDNPHPPLALLITTNEESGMTGAKAVDESHFSEYTYLINMDTEEEGKFIIGCSGALRHSIHLRIDRKDFPENYETFALNIKGLSGGHSGADIFKNLANANNLLGTILDSFGQKNFFISYINGGIKENAIAREATVHLSFPKGYDDQIHENLAYIQFLCGNDYKKTDPYLHFDLEKIENPKQVFSSESTKNLVLTFFHMPYGILDKEYDSIHALESIREEEIDLSNNIGVIRTHEDYVDMYLLTRGDLDFRREQVANRIQAMCKVHNAEYVFHSEYDGWKSESFSNLQKICVQVYKDLYKKPPKLTKTHVGIECGILSRKMPHLDMISFGPNNYKLHTPDEHLSISSTERVYNFLLKVLEKLK